MTDAMRAPRLESGAAAVVGIGHTDWVEDYRRVRDGERPGASESYAIRAFVRALADSGLRKADIDGLIVGPTTAYERTAEAVGLNPRWGGQEDAVGAIVNRVDDTPPAAGLPGASPLRESAVTYEREGHTAPHP